MIGLEIIINGEKYTFANKKEGDNLFFSFSLFEKGNCHCSSIPSDATKVVTNLEEEGLSIGDEIKLKIVSIK